MPVEDNKSLSVSTPEPMTELALRKQQEEHQFEYAMASLKVTERDREATRAHDRKCQKNGVWVLAGTAVTILIITILPRFSSIKSNLSLSPSSIWDLALVVAARGMSLDTNVDGDNSRSNPSPSPGLPGLFY